ncbi:MAG: sensor histidine kinase [Schaalia turicensis]
MATVGSDSLPPGGEAPRGLHNCVLNKQDPWERSNVRERGHKQDVHVHILVIGDDSRGLARQLTTDMGIAFPNLCLDRIDSGADLNIYDASLGPADHVVLGLVTSEVTQIDDLLDQMDGRPILEPTRWLVVTDQDEHTDLARATTSDRLASVISVPWTVPLLLGQSYSTMVGHLEADGRTDDEIHLLLGDPPANAVRGPLLTGLDHSEHDVVRELLIGVEKVLGPRPRLVIEPGTELAVQGQPVGAVHLVLDGDVSLHRDSNGGEVLAHLASSGPLIGLVSLARRENAFFTATATSTARVVRLTHEQLSIALLEEPSLATPLAALAIQSLTRRLMRAEDLHLENAMLAADLERQKQELARTLEDLRSTRAELVNKARFAMLGELSAGIAHELNNPITALARAAEHLNEDIDRVLSTSPSLEPARTSMRSALEAPPRSTATEREIVKSLLSSAGGDRRLARRLMLAGVTEAATAKALARGGDEALNVVESGSRIGSSLRSIRAASDRVIDLTKSLKGYARPDAVELHPIDVREGVDDVIRLTGYRMRDIVVTRDEEDVPPIMGIPSRLQQVWTNILVNAAEAIDDERDAIKDRRAKGEECAPARGEAPAQIDITTRVEDGHVCVVIGDNGPGISPELVDKIFEPHFTTKAGMVRFGLGMGMSIVRSIIADHGGELTVESRPGRTVMTARFPMIGDSATESVTGTHSSQTGADSPADHSTHEASTPMEVER